MDDPYSIQRKMIGEVAVLARKHKLHLVMRRKRLLGDASIPIVCEIERGKYRPWTFWKWMGLARFANNNTLIPNHVEKRIEFSIQTKNLLPTIKLLIKEIQRELGYECVVAEESAR